MLICPYFEEGGRLTIGNIHYVRGGGQFPPVGETEFARDATFGYHASDLRGWVAEKTKGAVSASDVARVSLADIRDGGAVAVRDRLLSLADIRDGGAVAVRDRLLTLPRGAYCVVNAACPSDLAIFVAGLLAAENAGRRYLYRTAASLAAARAGITKRPLLTANKLGLTGNAPGLVVAGSYVGKTTEQLAALSETLGNRLCHVEVPVASLLGGAGERAGAVAHSARAADAALARGVTPVLFTSRSLSPGGLSVGETVSSALVDIVQALTSWPAWIVAKGGITSSDIATKTLGIRRALVLGQIAPSVLVWLVGAKGRYSDIPYIVFPGNVGERETLGVVVGALLGGGKP